LSLLGCTGLLSPVCQAAGSIGSGAAGDAASAVLSAVATWVVDGASWLLGQVGGALTSSTSIDLGAGWFTANYQVMVGLAGVVVVPLLLLSVIQAIYRQSVAALVRLVAVQLPLALLLAAVAVQLVRFSLTVTDAMGSLVSSGVGANIQSVLSGLAGALLAQVGSGPFSVPSFAVLLGACLVGLGAFALWLELLVRAAAVYVAVLFLPLALASLVWPPIAHWCRRLVDTLVALVLAKFVIVAILSLAVSAVASGTQAGFASVLGGGALLLLAAFTPFTLLRLVPAVEAGAVLQLEGARHRVRHAVESPARSAASFVLRQHAAASLDPGEPGTGARAAAEPPGDGDGSPDQDGPVPEGGAARPAGAGLPGQGRDGGGGGGGQAPPPGTGGRPAGRGPGDPVWGPYATGVADAVGPTGVGWWRGIRPSAGGSLPGGADAGGGEEGGGTPVPWFRGPIPVRAAPMPEEDGGVPATGEADAGRAGAGDGAADGDGPGAGRGQLPHRHWMAIRRDELGPVLDHPGRRVGDGTGGGGGGAGGA
jgi:hypothetical protein